MPQLQPSIEQQRQILLSELISIQNPQDDLYRVDSNVSDNSSWYTVSTQKSRNTQTSDALTSSSTGLTNQISNLMQGASSSATKKGKGRGSRLTNHNIELFNFFHNTKAPDGKNWESYAAATRAFNETLPENERPGKRLLELLVRKDKHSRNESVSRQNPHYQPFMNWLNTKAPNDDVWRSSTNAKAAYEAQFGAILNLSTVTYWFNQAALLSGRKMPEPGSKHDIFLQLYAARKAGTIVEEIVKEYNKDKTDKISLNQARKWATIANKLEQASSWAPNTTTTSAIASSSSRQTDSSSSSLSSSTKKPKRVDSFRVRRPKRVRRSLLSSPPPPLAPSSLAQPAASTSMPTGLMSNQMEGVSNTAVTVVTPSQNPFTKVNPQASESSGSSSHVDLWLGNEPKNPTWEALEQLSSPQNNWQAISSTEFVRLISSPLAETSSTAATLMPSLIDKLKSATVIKQGNISPLTTNRSPSPTESLNQRQNSSSPERTISPTLINKPMSVVSNQGNPSTRRPSSSAKSQNKRRNSSSPERAVFPKGFTKEKNKKQSDE